MLTYVRTEGSWDRFESFCEWTGGRPMSLETLIATFEISINFAVRWTKFSVESVSFVQENALNDCERSETIG